MAEHTNERFENGKHSKHTKIEKKIKEDLEAMSELGRPILVFYYKSQQGGMNPPSISAVGNYRGWLEIEVTLDSGACDTVMPLSLCSETVLRESVQQRNGLDYEVANNASIRNEGERRCLMMTRNPSDPRRITLQVADVHKALLSITRAADAGYECHLGARGGCLLDVYTGGGMPIAPKCNLYVVKAWVRDDPEAEQWKNPEEAYSKPA